MLFGYEKEVVFVKSKSLTSSKTGKPFMLVTIADPDTFENVEFFPSVDADWNTVKPGTRVKIQLDVDSRSTSVVRVK